MAANVGSLDPPGSMNARSQSPSGSTWILETAGGKEAGSRRERQVTPLARSCEQNVGTLLRRCGAPHTDPSESSKIQQRKVGWTHDSIDSLHSCKLMFFLADPDIFLASATVIIWRDGTSKLDKRFGSELAVGSAWLLRWLEAPSGSVSPEARPAFKSAAQQSRNINPRPTRAQPRRRT